MPKTKISEFSATPANNTDIDSINISEGCAPSGINDAIRELMSQLKDWQSGTSNDPYVVGSSGSLTLNQGTANTVPYLNGSKVVTSGTALSFDGSNLGIALTPSAWRSGGGVLEINAATNGYIAINNGGGGILQNAYRDASGFVYKNTGTASYFNMTGDGVFAWNRASSGTAGNAITFTQAMTLDASGNLLVGATSAAGNSKGYFYANADTSHTVRITNASSGSSAYANLVVSNNAGNVVELGMQSSNRSTTYPANEAWMYTSNGINIGYSGDVKFYTGGTERARIDSSGNLLVGTTSNAGGGGATFNRSGNSNFVTWINNSLVDGATHASFRTNGTQVGFISTSSGVTIFSTTSDYRLKNVVGAVTGQGERIDALEPIEYEWKSNGSRTRGFLAHKFQEVYAGSVIGAKDAVDADGNPVYQGMQAGSSEVIADLVAEIKALRVRVAQLESK